MSNQFIKFGPTGEIDYHVFEGTICISMCMTIFDEKPFLKIKKRIVSSVLDKKHILRLEIETLLFSNRR
jgi:hypothetical protein